MKPLPTSVSLSLQQQWMLKSQNKVVRLFSTPSRLKIKLNMSDIPTALDKKGHYNCIIYIIFYLCRQSGGQALFWALWWENKEFFESSEERSQLYLEFSSLEYLEAMCLRGLSISRDIKQCSWLHVINKYPLALLWIAEMVASVSQKVSNLDNYIQLLSDAPVA